MDDDFSGIVKTSIDAIGRTRLAPGEQVDGSSIPSPAQGSSTPATLTDAPTEEDPGLKSRDLTGGAGDQMQLPDASVVASSLPSLLLSATSSLPAAGRNAIRLNLNNRGLSGKSATVMVDLILKD